MKLFFHLLIQACRCGVRDAKTVFLGIQCTAFLARRLPRPTRPARIGTLEEQMRSLFSYISDWFRHPSPPYPAFR